MAKVSRIALSLRLTETKLTALGIADVLCVCVNEYGGGSWISMISDLRAVVWLGS
jgi:hypothetical protein